MGEPPRVHNQAEGRGSPAGEEDTSTEIEEKKYRMNVLENCPNIVVCHKAGPSKPSKLKNCSDVDHFHMLTPQSTPHVSGQFQHPEKVAENEGRQSLHGLRPKSVQPARVVHIPNAGTKPAVRRSGGEHRNIGTESNTTNRSTTGKLGQTVFRGRRGHTRGKKDNGERKEVRFHQKTDEKVQQYRRGGRHVVL